LTTLAATELAGTPDEEIQARAAGLRGSVFRKKVMNRVSAYPDLNPPIGRRDVAPSEGPLISTSAPKPANLGLSPILAYEVVSPSSRTRPFSGVKM
jgi:hypothetical protein